MAKSQTPAANQAAPVLPGDEVLAPIVPAPIEEVLPPIEKGVDSAPLADGAPASAAPDVADEAPAEADEAPTGLKKFECWQARPKYLFRMDPETGQQERYLAEVEKTGAKPLFTTHIEQHHADTLNAQVENSGQYYFAV